VSPEVVLLGSAVALGLPPPKDSEGGFVSAVEELEEVL